MATRHTQRVDAAVEVTQGDGQFDLTVDGAAAGRSEFRDRPGGVRVFTHTEVDPAFGGRGLGTLLVRQALDATRAAGLSIKPSCPFVRAFVDRHTEYGDLVAPDPT